VATESETSGGPRPVPLLALWAVAVLSLNALTWATGLRPVGLAVAVDQGAARAEATAIGEVPDDVVRESIRLQRDTLPFWTALVAVGDFVIEPLAPALRATLAAVLLSGLAALTGRTIGFGPALGAASAAQGWWVLGLGVRVGLMIALRRDDAETSLALALPAGAWDAPTWVAARQVDAFALIGWASIAIGSWRRGQAGPVTAAMVCILLWAAEAMVHIAASLVLGAGMRLTLVPETPGA